MNTLEMQTLLLAYKYLSGFCQYALFALCGARACRDPIPWADLVPQVATCTAKAQVGSQLFSS